MAGDPHGFDFDVIRGGEVVIGHRDGPLDRQLPARPRAHGPCAPAQPRPMSISAAAQAALDEVLDRDDPSILGIVLSGSAARALATERSDIDVFVVLTDDAAEGRTTSRSPAIDEFPQTLADNRVATLRICSRRNPGRP